MVKFDEEVNYKLVVQGSVFHDLLENYKHHVISTKKEGNEIRWLFRSDRATHFG
jgi:hypothetical protein